MGLIHLGLPFAIKLPPGFLRKVANDAPYLYCADGIATNQRQAWDEVIT